MQEDTIVAIATALTNSGIGIIRISGEESFTIIDKIYKSKNGKKKLSQVPSHTMHYGFIYDDDKVIDEVMVAVMRSPKSYTMEDTVEINCHGGTLVMRRVLETAIRHGARLAEPGEFTKRAFLNGRIDLSQAESVMDVINARNDFALESSIRQLCGSVKIKIEAIRKKIIHEIAFIESALDDPEHISIDGYGIELDNKITDVCAEIKDILVSFENGELLKEGIRTVIVGKPNAGKSSLMNVLVGRERAIVTNTPGTTRDVLEEQINLDGITLNIADTAGIRKTEDMIEKIGVEKAKDYLAKADLIIYVVDASVGLDKNDKEILELLENQKVLILLNKADLAQIVTEEDFKEILWERGLSLPIISISAKEETGIKELKRTIQDMFFTGEITCNDEVCITNVRHKADLQSALDSLLLVKSSIENQMPEDFYSIDLMNAYESLGSIIGASVGEDLVNEIFSKFCMGK